MGSLDNAWGLSDVVATHCQRMAKSKEDLFIMVVRSCPSQMEVAKLRGNLQFISKQDCRL